MKIKFNENLISILNFIDNNSHSISFREMLQWCIDMECYEDYYKHYHIIKPILDEHNKKCSNDLFN